MSTNLSHYRFLSRPAKLNNADKTYACQCGKTYLSFPSLYLHFQKKHQLPISTKSSAKNRLVKNVNGKIQEIYYYSKNLGQDEIGEEKEKPEQLSNEQKNTQKQDDEIYQFDQLQQVLNEFSTASSHHNQISQSKQFIRSITSQLQRYLSQQSTLQHNIFFYTSGFHLKQLPYFFNPFIRDKVNHRGCSFQEKDIVRSCKVLLCLGKWLKRGGYTNLTIEYDNIGSRKQKS